MRHCDRTNGGHDSHAVATTAFTHCDLSLCARAPLCTHTHTHKQCATSVGGIMVALTHGWNISIRALYHSLL